MIGYKVAGSREITCFDVTHLTYLFVGFSVIFCVFEQSVNLKSDQDVGASADVRCQEASSR